MASPHKSLGNLERTDQALLLCARLMEGGQEDDETIKDLDLLTKLLDDDIELVNHEKKADHGNSASTQSLVTRVIDLDCVDTLSCYLDTRQSGLVRGHALLAMSSYLKAAGESGSQTLSEFFQRRVKKGTFDDYVIAFSVAAALFPIASDLTSSLCLGEGFLPSLGPLMQKKWKSRKVEIACLEMLNAACMNSACRDAVAKYCSDWLEVLVDQHPDDAVRQMLAANLDVYAAEGSVAIRRHSEQVQQLAAVVLAKLKAVQAPHKLATPSDLNGPEQRVEQASTSIDELSLMFTHMIVSGSGDESQKYSVEGMAYATIRPNVREDLSRNAEALKCLVKILEKAPPRSPLTYGALSIFINLTRYQPVKSEEEKKIDQLKAYANAAGNLYHNPLLDDEHVTERCMRVFNAGLTPILVSHSNKGSVASLSLIISIIHALSATHNLRGPLAQQGAVRLLVSAWPTLPETEVAARRAAAQALARILISTNPNLVFGGTRPTPQSASIPPLASLLVADPTAETRDLLPTFEALMALTNLASTNDCDTRRAIVRTTWTDIEEHLLASNQRVARAAAELVCNLVQQTPEACALYDPSPSSSSSFSSDPENSPHKARNRLHVLIALTDATDEGIRSAAGGALAALTTIEPIVRAVCARDHGVQCLLGLCADDSDDLRHRGAVIIGNLASADGLTGTRAREKVLRAGGIDILTECVKKSHRAEVVQAAAEVLQILLESQVEIEGNLGE